MLFPFFFYYSVGIIQYLIFCTDRQLYFQIFLPNKPMASALPKSCNNLCEIYIILKYSLIIHEENTKEITGVKESVYVIQTHVDLHKL
jgi:hypothetical protein